MAGFADEISHFNPYIAQMPVDDYINSGMMLQSKYDQGVAKSQNMIDSISGLPMAGEANTAYLRDKVTDLEGKVSKIAGSDFSKNNVTNQVGSMIGQIYKDPVVQAGVQAAVRYGKYQKSWDDLRKDHPDQYSDKNKEYFDQYWNDYFKQSQTKAGLQASGPTEANPYTDYYDKIDKQLKGLDPSIQTSISPAGEFMYRIDKSSTVSRDQVDGIINSQMLADPRMQQQMQIDAWHSYRSFDGLGMFDHVAKSFGAMIDNYKANAKYYQDVIKANPNDYQTITASQKKILDFNTEIKTLQTNRDTYLDALNNGKVDEVKQAVFNDSVRQGLILKYERSNITSDLHNNENAIEAWKNTWEQRKYNLEEEKLGIERDKLDIERAKAKKEIGETQSVTIAGLVPDSYTESQHLSTIQGIQDGISGTLSRLRSYHSNMSDPEWKSYLDNQNAKYLAGDQKVDPKFAQYKSITQSQQALLDTYRGISTKIQADADTKYDLTKVIPEGTTFHNVPIEEGGKIRTANVYAKRELVTKALDVSEEAMKVFGATGMNEASKVDIEKAVANAASKYKDDPNYKYILGLAKSGDQMNNMRKAALELNSQKRTFMDNAYADFGKTTSYQAHPITAKAEVVKGIARLTATAAAQAGDNVEADKLNPLNYYNDDQNRLVIQYQKEKDGKTYQVEVPAARNTLGDPDPYQPLQRVIDLSPNHATPGIQDPKQALSSVNGRIKYVLQKDPINGQDIELRIWDKGALYTVPARDMNQNGFSRPNIGSYVERVEWLSHLSDQERDKQIATLGILQ